MNEKENTPNPHVGFGYYALTDARVPRGNTGLGGKMLAEEGRAENTVRRDVTSGVFGPALPEDTPTGAYNCAYGDQEAVMFGESSRDATTVGGHSGPFGDPAKAEKYGFWARPKWIFTPVGDFNAISFAVMKRPNCFWRITTYLLLGFKWKSNDR